MKNIITTLFITCILTGCVSMAKLSDFSQTSNSIDFDKLSKEFKLTKTPFWTLKTSNEYYFEKDTHIEEAKLIETIKNGLRSYNYSIPVSNLENKCIIGQRGMVANEWNSITAIYYRLQPNKIQVYLNTKISQDITGGWRENRAMKVGKLIEQNILQ
jgi:hypothetical protein